MSAPKLTAAQRRALALIRSNGTIYDPDTSDKRIHRRVLASLERRGLIDPIHSVEVTDAGRAALKDGGS